MKIILDTNFIITCLNFKIDLFSEINITLNEKYEIFVLDKTIDELNKFKSKLALQLLDKFKVKIIKTIENLDVDSLILKIADKNTIVATQDKELRKNLKIKGIKILTIRQKKYFMII